MESVNGFELPPAPASETGRVKAWVEPVIIPSYEPAPPDKNPMFLERRVYQGSSGKVYPLPFIDRISTERTDRAWQAVHLENEFIRVMILPEIGGRIHVGLDKTNGYDFFYRQNVIKPALVGLAGPWISGGVEFNWPQHHRPATFMPVAFSIERHEDGSQTVWLSDHDPMNRMKGMHGVCLHPERSFIELKVRLYNRTPLVQTFLWWANVAVRVHEHYQSFFPPDVHFVADHAKRAISEFPLCRGRYYGVDYEARARNGVPPDEMPACFVPPGRYPPNDLSWYANIPVPTSYMALGSRGDFFGGYDHAKQAGVVHIADHHIAPGKKQWTWGNHEFGYAWDRNLTDADGPYIELMAGVYTDNQPDFSFLMPGETKSFRQYWYPIREIGPAQNANRDAAVSLHIANGLARVGVAVSGIFEQNTVIFETTETRIEWSCDLQPGKPFVVECAAPGFEPRLRVLDWNQRETISYAPVAEQKTVPPHAAAEPALPSEIESSDELYLTGLHLAQYRHTTRLPEFYWQEALRRDPGDARSNNALGLWHLRRGEFKAAEQHFRAAIARLTERNPNPYEGEPFYNLGLALRYLGRQGDAYDAFYKAAWNQPWRAAAHHALAEIDAARQNWPHALEHLEQGLALNRGNLQTRNLLVLVLRKAGQTDKAERMLQETLALDPLDIWANDLAGRPFAADNQMRMDLAIDYLHAGLLCEARCVLAAADFTACDGSVPMLYYALGYLSADDDARAFYRQAAEALPDYCFPARLEEMLFLEAALAANPADAHAHLYLGNLLYDKRRHQEAIEHWRAAADLDGTLATAWRNLGIAAYNIERNVEQAREYYERAIAAGAADARVYYERDQLHKRAGVNARARLAEMERRPDLVAQRDDATVELAALYNQTGAPEKAAAVLASRKFQPWEGGEGAALGQHVRTQLALGRRALSAERWDEARDRFQAALDSPANLGEAKHLLANQSNIYFWLGTAHAAQDQAGAAQACWQRASRYLGDFQEMSVKPYSEMTLYSALALRKLGRTTEAEGLLRELLSYAEGLLAIEAKIDYFATSLPSMLLFEEDLAEKNRIVSQLLQAQAALGLGDTESATAILRQVLADDPNHAAAHDLQEELPLLSRESTCIHR